MAADNEATAYAAFPTWLSAHNLAAIFGVSRRTIRRYVAEGRLPPPRKFTGRTLRWHRSEVWLLSRHGPELPGTFHRLQQFQGVQESG